MYERRLGRAQRCPPFFFRYSVRTRNGVESTSERTDVRTSDDLIKSPFSLHIPQPPRHETRIRIKDFDNARQQPKCSHLPSCIRQLVSCTRIRDSGEDWQRASLLQGQRTGIRVFLRRFRPYERPSNFLVCGPCRQQDHDVPNKKFGILCRQRPAQLDQCCVLDRLLPALEEKSKPRKHMGVLPSTQ